MPSEEIPLEWLKTSNSCPCAMPISAMPSVSTVRIASAVGAETAMMKPAPIAAVFCTISTDIRLVRMTAPVPPGTPLCGKGTGELVECVVAGDVFANDHVCGARVEKSRGSVACVAWPRICDAVSLSIEWLTVTWK
jgi:hypothetical protein